MQGNIFFYGDQPFPKLFKYREIAVYDCIQQGVGQIIGPQIPDFSFS